MAVADAFKPSLSDCSSSLPIIHVCRTDPRGTKGQAFKGEHHMLRLALAIAIAAPLLSGCIIVSTEKPTTRVITAPASGQ